jgi:RNA polymerase sigma-70 factor (ECF subfamily)
VPSNDDAGVSTAEPAPGQQGTALLDLYDTALPQVYGYLLVRAGSPPLAEDLTSDTFLAAVRAIERGKVPDLTVAWLITVARNKLVDHWRRQAREERGLRLVHDTAPEEEMSDGLDEQFDRARAREVLATLGAHHRAALTLRYLDGLSVPEVAACLGRTVHAAEALLVRARHAFRVAFAEAEGRCDDD